MRKRIIVVSSIVAVVVLFPITHTVEVDVKVAPPKPVPVQTKATWEQKKYNKALAMRYAKAGWGWDRHQRQCIYDLFMAESKFDHLAKNQQGSSAYGIAQMLKEKSRSPEIQLLKAYKYIVHRYDTPCQAWRHHQRRNWY